MTQKQSYFIEGLQRAGKSTLVNRLAEKLSGEKGLPGGRLYAGGFGVVCLCG